jgi:hypothetical protein
MKAYPAPGVWIVLALLMVACHYPPVNKIQDEARAAYAPPVCWFYQPVRGNLIGSVGIARTLAIGGAKRVEQLAKQRAALGLSAYIGNREPHFRWIDIVSDQAGNKTCLRRFGGSRPNPAGGQPLAETTQQGAYGIVGVTHKRSRRNPCRQGARYQF